MVEFALATEQDRFGPGKRRAMVVTIRSRHCVDCPDQLLRNLGTLVCEHSEIQFSQLRGYYLERFGHEFAPGAKLKEALTPAVEAGKLKIETRAGQQIWVVQPCKADVVVNDGAARDFLLCIQQQLGDGHRSLWRYVERVCKRICVAASGLASIKKLRCGVGNCSKPPNTFKTGPSYK